MAQLQGFDTCFLCNERPETNDHFWTCSESVIILRPIFIKYWSILRSLIYANLDHTKIASLAIDFNLPIFTWTSEPTVSIQDIPDLYCLLINLVPDTLVAVFKQAQIGKSTYRKLLLSFLANLHRDIYESLWRRRSVA